MIKVIVSDEGVSEFETLSEALDEVLDFSNVTMIDTHTKTTYVYDEDATLCFEHQFEDSTDINPFSKEEMEIVRSALEFAGNNAEGLTKMVINNIIDKI
ncbi:hypothetical protein VPT02_090 [Vibrio phage VPT02]|nr:hypothetical protein VPT02_090 [Vibrio phage VPT02]